MESGRRVEQDGQTERGWPSSTFGAGAGIASKKAKKAKKANVVVTLLTLLMESASVLGW